MKKVWYGIGIVIIVILLLLTTRFSEFLQMEDGGHAVLTDSVVSMLMRDPLDGTIEENVAMHSFSSLEWIYARGNSYYMGEDKKEKIDLAFPLYINDGAALYFTQNVGSIYAMDYEEEEVYNGLVISEGITYNQGGERADAGTFLFYQTSNGFFMNLLGITYMDAEEEREIKPNSIIYFTEDHITYYEYQDGQLIYKKASGLQKNSQFFVGGEWMDYYDLLLKLHIVYEPTKKEETVSEPYIPIVPELTEPIVADNALPEEEDSVEEEEPKEEREEPEQEHHAAQVPKDEESDPYFPDVPRRPNNQRPPSHAPNALPLGVRPDSLRPDRQTTTAPVAEDYVKPSVSIGELDTRTYRILIPITVSDPARRIHSGRKIQIEFYEQKADGSEELVYRTFSGSTQTITAGNGAIKPNTTYRVNAYYTYFDEKNTVTVESLISKNVTTGTLSADAKITFNDQVISYYYDNHLEISSLSCNMTTTDAEALYGVGRTGGVTLKITGTSAGVLGFTSETRLDSKLIRELKEGKSISVLSVPNLKANQSYQYEIIINDFFGDALNVQNNTGTFDTCKARPKGTINVQTNEIGNVVLNVKVTDEDVSAIPKETGSNLYNVYLVVSSEKSSTTSGAITKEECQEFLDQGSRVENSRIHYVYQFTEDQYTYDTTNGLQINTTQIAMDSLLLNTKYYAYLYCDFNLNNRAGDVRFGEIGNLNFTSASLSSLGNIFVKVDISNVSANSVDIIYTLNTDRTNDILEAMLSSVSFNIVRSDGAEPITDSYIDLDDPSLENFKAGVGIYMAAKDYFPGNEDGQNALQSMQEYKIVPKINAMYQGIEYPMEVTLSNSEFKTMRAPAEVQLEDVLLAAGTLRFHVNVYDKDDSITGNSGHMVVINVYKFDGTFVQALRIPKNQEQDIEIGGLESGTDYIISFLALEYNEGYDNTTFQSNYVLEELTISESVSLSGAIKLQSLSSRNEAEMVALINTSFEDQDKIMAGMDYYIDVTCDGVDVTVSNNYPSSYPAFNRMDYSDSKVGRDLTFIVKKGEHTYGFTMFVMVNGQKLILDTLTFTTESEIIGIHNEWEFIHKIQENSGKGKYVVCTDLNFDSTEKYSENPGATGLSPRNIVEIFDGEIDFQGFDLSYNYRSDGSNMFHYLGEHANLYNMVLKASMVDTTSRMYDEGILCRYNYGYIHDVYVIYEGGDYLNNAYCGILCGSNAVSGVIENFVVKNCLTEDCMPFCVYSNGGLVTGTNYGTVRYGYVYGEDIYADVVTNSPGSGINVGGIIGNQGASGTVQNVYSLVNILVPSPGRNAAGNPVSNYGSVLGGASGRVTNVYGIGQSFYSQPYNGETFDGTRGPVAGNSGSRNSNVYYWNEANIAYTGTLSNTQKQIGVETLYDYSWQSSLLGSEFRTRPVEVGYYPQVQLSSELPLQEFLPLPERAQNRIVDVMSMSLAEYIDDGQAAIVDVRLSNPMNAEINGFIIENLTATIVEGSVSSVDGYTTLQLKVSDPSRFCSSYALQEIEFYLNGRQQKATYDPAPILLADFYRPIYNANDWYNYVVKAPTENAKLMNDIDFTGVNQSKIRVTSTYSGKLSGGGTDATIGYSLQNVTLSTYAYIFYSVTGTVKDICVDNLNIGSASKPQASPAFIQNLYGYSTNVHMSDVTIYGYNNVGSIVSTGQSASILKNCSARNVNIQYREPANTNTNGRIGGLIGNAYYCHVTNCYTSGLNIEAEDIKNCQGAGGIVGYSSYSIIDGAYAEGDIVVRGSYVGGICGEYTSNISNCCFENVISNVNVVSYQDKVGGLIGDTLIESVLTSKTNMNGVAYGSVFANNPNSENVSYTVGSFTGAVQDFYGTSCQLLNGMPVLNCDAHTCALLTDEEMKIPTTYSDIVGMGNVFDYSYVTSEYMPHIYYEGTTIELPFQENLSIKAQSISNNEIDIYYVSVDTNNHKIIIDLINPNGYTVTGVEVEDLVLDDSLMEVSPDRIVLTYRGENNQTRWKDSYLLTSLSYRKVDNGVTTVGVSDYSEQPVRIPLTLYRDIYTVEDWSSYINDQNNYGNYDNYRIMADIDFSGYVYTVNCKLGRLVGGKTSGSAVLSNINLTGSNVNLIFRLNSEMKNIVFKDCSIESKGRDCVGLIGTSAAVITNVDFDNVRIQDKDLTRSFMGVIGCQVGGALEDITLTNVIVGAEGNKQQYVGGLVGYSTGGTTFSNLDAHNLTVNGKQYVGGIVGYTARASFDTINVTDARITSSVGFLGGVVGYYDCPRTTVNGPYMRNIHVTGTPTYDSSGIMNGSSTVIALTANPTTGTYVGGICGLQRGYKNGWETSTSTEMAEKSLVVDGIVVSGYASYLGGACGYSQDLCNALVKNTLITESKTCTVDGSVYVGGVSGYANAYFNYNTAENVRIETNNHSAVGGVLGYRSSWTHSYYLIADNCMIIANKTGNYTTNNVGGVVGKSELIIGNSMAINTTVNTTTSVSGSGYTEVGGIVGYCANNITRCYYYATPTSDSQAVAQSNYFVKGYANVGGIAGRINAGTLGFCYSNANVIAHNYAGGIVGVYNNAYTRTNIGSSVVFSYSTTYLYHNYFAGSVRAENNYAGGLIGQTTMATSVTVDAEHKISGGRTTVKDSEGHASGRANETAYTYRNFILADYVIAENGDTENAFSGTTASFEGNANNTSKTDRANRTYIWEGLKLGSMDYSSAIWGLQQGNDVYPSWKNTETANSGNYNVRLVTTEDLSNKSMYKSIGWFSTSNASMKGYYYRMLCDTNTTAAEWTQMGDAAFYQGQNYLPHIRINTNTGNISDWLTKKQSAYQVAIPVPVWNHATFASGASLFMAALEPSQTRIYCAGADVVNVEFAEDYVNNGYFKLYYGNSLIEENSITERVISYQYDFNDEIRLEYGYGSLEVADPMLSEIFTMTPMDLQHYVMVYGSEYYLIQDGVIHGNTTLDEATVLPGVYLNLYNGEALNDNAEVIDIATGTVKRVVNGGMNRLSAAIPLQRFVYQQSVVETYAGMTEYVGDSNVTTQNSQFFLGMDGTIGMIQGDMDNIRDSILLYTKDGKTYQTILGSDGIMIDLAQGANVNTPDGFKKSGIRYMTNNLNTTVPFVVVEYWNGGMAGYNYMTGEMLFDCTISENLSLFAYAQEYFSPQTSMYASASTGYAANVAVIQNVNTATQLETMLTGTTAQTGEQTATANGEQSVAGSNTAIASGEREVTTSSNYGDPTGQTADLGGDDSDTTVVSGNTVDNETAVSDNDTGSETASVSNNSTGSETASVSDNSTGNGTASVSDNSTGNGTASVSDNGTGNGAASVSDNGTGNGAATVSDNMSVNESSSISENSSGNSETTDTTEDNRIVSSGGTVVAGAQAMITTEPVMTENGEIVADVSALKEATTDASLLTVYNPATGLYEIVDMDSYRQYHGYHSENERLQIQNIAERAGYATVEPEKKRANGLSLYIAVASLVIIGVVVTYQYKKRYRKQHKETTK